MNLCRYIFGWMVVAMIVTVVDSKSERPGKAMSTTFLKKIRHLHKDNMAKLPRHSPQNWMEHELKSASIYGTNGSKFSSRRKRSSQPLVRNPYAMIPTLTWPMPSRQMHGPISVMASSKPAPPAVPQSMYSYPPPSYMPGVDYYVVYFKSTRPLYSLGEEVYGAFPSAAHYFTDSPSYYAGEYGVPVTSRANTEYPGKEYRAQRGGSGYNSSVYYNTGPFDPSYVERQPANDFYGFQ